ncbi:hypothetical protein HBI23_130700 [Parastagonospora nodorum]|nr:hypothetical protein HBH46_053290 [Parastagonospora nodorum]KAH4927235.1 hypothetical protein HBI79_141570 [Parastagonospora nodorum]KAH5017048.1 hypothetical protein HBI75_176330 [Parastagonospora nodorum]KAH5442457.1 hypothetical protein HBI47_030210 [Parastagonospora nodorum]KAH5660164.1 hypothetical protein HBI23_130700 [Parastagonospora nodorum]
MPVLEITQLRLKSVPANNPSLLQNLSAVREQLQTKSQFYTCTEDSAKLYILGIWRDLNQHLDFLASPARDEVLGPQEDMLDFEWTVHIEVDGMESLPLDAPVLAIERLVLKGNGVLAFEQAIEGYVQQLQGNTSFKIVHNWRCDTASPKAEAVFLTGWQNVEDDVGFSKRLRDRGGLETAGIVGQILLHHARNIERKDVYQT